MISSIEVENFKSFGSPAAVARCAAVTLIYGPNSAGKSTITQALRLMQRQMAEDSPGLNPFAFEHWDRWAGYEWMGPYETLRHRHAAAGEPTRITCRFEKEVADPFVRLTYAAETGAFTRLEVGVNDKAEFTLFASEHEARESFDKGLSGVRFLDPGRNHIVSATCWRSLPGDGSRSRDEEAKKIALWGKRLKGFFKSELCRIGPQRPSPSRSFVRAATVTGVSSLSTMPSMDAAGFDIDDDKEKVARRLVRLLEEKPQHEKRVNDWLEKLGLGVKLDVEQHDGGHRFRLHPMAGGRPIALPDVGFGLSQVLAIVVLAAAKENSTIIIEQPELHIHPRLQAEIGDLFIESAKERGNQFIIETHSEHLCLRLLKRVRQAASSGITEDFLSVQYVNPGDRGAEVYDMVVGSSGQILSTWPGGFFPERVEEILGA